MSQPVAMLPTEHSLPFFIRHSSVHHASVSPQAWQAAQSRLILRCIAIGLCVAIMLCCMQASQVYLRGEEAAQEGAAAAGARSGRAPAGAGAQIHPQAA